jgi:hypothetical protein
MHALHLQRSVERFGERVVIADSRPAYRLPDTEFLQFAGELG